MKTMFLLVFGIFIGLCATAQVSYEVLTVAPEKVSNNAVSAVEVDGNWYVYSFSGIDSTKQHSGIHSKVFRYDVANDAWMKMPFDLPTGPKRIAAGASTVQGKIYVLGGYQVFSNGNEVSVDKMHVYDPVLDMFLDDASPIPKAIDDHVQCVYEDSLIYVVTGWSNSGNVSDVWIYDVTLDQWKAGTGIPNSNEFQAFGASGTIVGDTLYYVGGARDVGSFGLISTMRKGYINPNDPTEITWILEDNPAAGIYRSGAGVLDGQAIWLGGSENTYNYNGIAYNGAGGVHATNAVIFYEPSTGELTKQFYDFPEIMDLRGLAQIGSNSFISVGGMENGQQVTNRVVRYDVGELVDVVAVPATVEFRVFPSATTGVISLVCSEDISLNSARIIIRDATGQQVYSEILQSHNSLIDLGDTIPSGPYFVTLNVNGKQVSNRRILKF